MGAVGGLFRADPSYSCAKDGWGDLTPGKRAQSSWYPSPLGLVICVLGGQEDGGLFGGRRSHLQILPNPFCCVANRVACQLYGQKGLPAWSSLRWLPGYQVFGFFHPSQRLCLHIICIHLHVVKAGPGITGENIFFSLGYLQSELDRAQVHRDQAYKILPSFGPRASSRASLPASLPHCGAWTPSQQAGGCPSEGAWVLLVLVQLPTCCVSQVTFLLNVSTCLWFTEDREVGVCVPEEVSRHSFIHSFI